MRLNWQGKGVDALLARPGCSSSLVLPEPGWWLVSARLRLRWPELVQAVYSVTIIADTRHNICNISLATHLAHGPHCPLSRVWPQSPPVPRQVRAWFHNLPSSAISSWSLQPGTGSLCSPRVTPALVWALAVVRCVGAGASDRSPPPRVSLTKCNSVLVQPPQSAVRLWAL